MSYKNLKINIIVALADNLARGRGNDMPWHLSEDLKYFKKTTSGHTVIMGRRTFESIGRPLPGRRNIVITRNPEENGLAAREGIECVPSLTEAFGKCLETGSGASVQEVFVIGGGSVYAQALEYADRLYLTRVRADIKDADTFFPSIPEKQWKTVSSSPEMRDEETGFMFNFEILERSGD